MTPRGRSAARLTGAGSWLAEEEVGRQLRADLSNRGDFNRVHFFPLSGPDAQDDQDVSLVVLRPTYSHTRQGGSDSLAITAAKSILESRGNTPTPVQEHPGLFGSGRNASSRFGGRCKAIPGLAVDSRQQGTFRPSTAPNGAVRWDSDCRRERRDCAYWRWDH